METYPVDIDPGQVVRWVMVERQAPSLRVRTLGRLTTETREIPIRSEFGLGDEEREDLQEIVTIATLDIAPIHAGDGWLLTVVIEDEAGPRLSYDRETVEAEEEIDLDTFYNEFIRPGRGNANVVAEVTGPEAKTRMTRLLNAIERNSHRSGGHTS